MKHLYLAVLLGSCSLLSLKTSAQCTSVPVTKTNSTKVYIHYMPWFSGPVNPTATGTSYTWGFHWKSDGSGANPNTFTNVTDYTGATVSVRNVDAHFHPLIGPYDQTDPYVIEYHLLLMKLSGIDGLMIDWYGLAGNGAADAGTNQNNTAAVIAKVGNYGLKYGLVVEDASMTNLPANLSYAATNYFTDANYIKLGDMRGSGDANASAPLVAEFEPYSYTNVSSWSNLGNTKAFLPLYGQAYNSVPSIAGGTFMWPDPQAGQGIVNGVPAWYNNTNSYYNGNATSIHNNFKENGVSLYNNVVLGTAYPGFFDFYLSNASSFTDPNANCSTCDKYGIIPRTYGASGNTFTTTLNLAQSKKAVIDGIQIATWNDFSEGTNIEPTVEYGFQSLVALQQFTGVSFTEKDLRYIDTLYMLRKQYTGNSAIQSALDQASCDMVQLNTAAAETLLSCIYKTGTSACASGPGMSNASASVTVNNPLNYQIIASTANGAITSYNATGLVPGLAINTTTGVISGTPINVGIDTITISASNSQASSSAALVLTINQPSAEQPYQGVVAAIPGIIQAENYDWGGQGVAYNDVDPATNNGNAYRLGEGVDIEANNDGGSAGYDVGWTRAGEWVQYTVNVTTPGTYTMTARVATGAGLSTKIFHVTLDGANLGTIHVPNTGGWATFQTTTGVTTPALTTGQKILRIAEDSIDYNINYLTFTLATAAPVINSSATAGGTQGTSFSYAITATNNPTSYAITGALPQGLTLTGNVLSGTPTQAGTFVDTLKATNAGGTGIQLLTITISPSVYTFTGDGNWDVASNWANNIIPPNPLPANGQIIINPSGTCIMNVSQTISAGATFTVISGKNLEIQGDLQIVQ